MADTKHGQGGPEFDWEWTRDHPTWVPPVVDTTKPSPARMYDYALGGKDNFAVDREAAEQILKVAPDGPELARMNRQFLVRTVGYLAEAGITQFLDLGTGIPTSPSVHEVARRAQPKARVVYVDNDPVVIAHDRALLATDPDVVTVLHDLRDPASVLTDPAVRSVIDFDRPVGLLMFAVLHFVDHTLAPEVVRQYTRRLAPGSHVAISAGASTAADAAVASRLESVYRQSTSPLFLRTPAQVEALLDGLTLVDPGLVEVNRWRNPDQPTPDPRILAAVARKD